MCTHASSVEPTGFSRAVLGVQVWRLQIFFILCQFCSSNGFANPFKSTFLQLREPRISLASTLQNVSPKDSTNKTHSFRDSRGIDNLQTLKESVDIVAALESFSLPQFRRTGPSRATAICPFHDDRNPSLSIDGGRQLFKCFACGEGGDVFHFVRKYNKLQGREMTFGQVVRYVSEEFSSGNHIPSRHSALPSPTTLQQRHDLEEKRQRILTANAAAAAFYSEALTRPCAGGARHYLVSRGFNATIVRRFGLGYAPNAYFSPKSTAITWGDGSLVQHLAKLGFTPKEIVDSGLAVLTKKAESLLNTTDDSNSTNSQNELTCDVIMDRFRGRVVVPIFDATGTQVLGFGGRILPLQENEITKPDFLGPKYLNSPETVAFQKKFTLFSHYLASTTLADTTTDTSSVRSVILVEGYMDVMSLSSVGVLGAVASMGTAISADQLELIAKMAFAKHAKVILCFDNDDAGTSAVERLCTNGMIKQVKKVYPVEILVAQLEMDCKDPAEFVESKVAKGIGKEEIGELFQTNVVASAKEWTDWRISRIMSEYDKSDDSKNFGVTFRRIAEFMATTLTQSEREERVGTIASKLAKLIGNDEGKLFFENDLLDMSGRFASAWESTQRRLEGVATQKDYDSFMKSLSRGLSHDDEETQKLSTEALAKMGIAPKRGKSRVHQPRKPGRMVDNNRNRTAARGSSLEREPKRQFKHRTRSIEEERDLTPHFSGIQYQHKSDRNWVRSVRNGKPLLALGEQPTRNRGPYEKRKRTFFNSNPYHGKQLLTEDARQAGYGSLRIRNTDNEIFEKGVASLVVPDNAGMALVAEDSLLREMIRSGGARGAVKSWQDTQLVLHDESAIEWSSANKQWLFETLLEENETLAATNKDPYLVFEHLKQRTDAPLGALTALEMDKNDHDIRRSGSLVHLFDSPGSDNEGLNCGQHSELFVRELLSTLLYSIEARKRDEMLHQLVGMSSTIPNLSPQNPQEPSNIADSKSGNSTNKEAVAVELMTPELEAMVDFQDATRKYLAVNEKLLSLAETRKRVGSNALDQKNAMRSEGRLSAALRDKVCADFDEFVQSLTHNSTIVLPPDNDDCEPFETTWERIEEEWGDWCDEDYKWSPEASQEIQPTASMAQKNMMEALQNSAEDDEEPVEDALRRMSEEWAGFED